MAEKSKKRKNIRRENENPNWNLFYISLAVFLVCIAVISLVVVLLSNQVLESKVIDASVIVTQGKIGFNLNNSMLSFGEVPKGGSSSSREVYIFNDRKFPVVLVISSFGNISKFSNYPEETIINSKKNVTISLSVSIPEDTKPGNYTGGFRFDIYKK